MSEVILICNDYYEVVDNSDCNAADEYYLVQLGPLLSYREYCYLEMDKDELPF
tara:strand:- start:491 stop:649 length:159 start_codon:yes stop_codon:yes gene_type:complete